MIKTKREINGEEVDTIENEGIVYTRQDLETSIAFLESGSFIALSVPNREDILTQNKELLKQFE